MDFKYNDDEQMVYDMCTRFAKEMLAEAGAEADRAREVPSDLLAAAAELGLFLDAIPADKDGYLEGEYNHTLRAVRSIALSAGCPGLTMKFEANTEFCLAAAALDFEAGLKDLAAAPGEKLACTVFESEAKPLSLKANKLSGTVGAVPNALGAAYYLFVSGDVAAESYVAIVEGNAKGLTVTDRDSMALRAASVGDIELKNVAPVAILSGSDADSLVHKLRASFRVLSASLAVGSATQALVNAEEYADERIQFGQPIGKFQSLARLIQDNRAKLEAAKYLTYAAANAIDTGTGFDVITKQAAEFAGQTATTAAIDAVQILGGYGFVNDYPVEKVMRDVRACTTLAGDGLQEMVFNKCA